VNPEIGVAFFGAGTVAEMDGRGISAVPNARCFGACDRNRSKAKAITARFGGRLFDKAAGEHAASRLVLRELVYSWSMKPASLEQVSSSLQAECRRVAGCHAAVVRESPLAPRAQR
jgi:predicted dehydrogenase